MSSPRARALALALGWGGCAGPALDTGLGATAPTYVDDVAPILAAHCTRCHSRETRLAAGVDLGTAAAARSTRVSATCTAVSSEVVDAFADALHPLGGTAATPCAGIAVGSMPPGAQARLSVADQLTLARWVAQGAPEE